MKKYDFGSTEKRWQEVWRKEGVYEPSLEEALRQAQGKQKSPFYNLMMFPYPSAEGLHVGNMYAFVGSDIYGRFKRMQGHDVFEPIGLDGFGIHAENYALKIGTHPMEQAKVSEERFYKQLEAIGNGFAWKEKLETYDSEYYRWTQWLFVQMFKRGLAYRKKQEVNWCPSCKTVLADEQVVKGSRVTGHGSGKEEISVCERCGTEVIKKELEQWFFKITNYAERLLKNLETLDWSDRVKIAQKNWIGKSEGLIFSSPVKDSNIKIETFSAHFQAFTADTFVVIAPDHPLLPKLLEGSSEKEKVLSFCKKIISEREKNGYGEREPEGIFTGRYTIDPVGNGELPIWVASYALKDYGTGIVKCSAHDERDFAFAKKYGITLKATLLPEDKKLREDVLSFKICYADMQNGILTEPAPFAGRKAGEVSKEIIDYCVSKNLARRHTTYRLRDWLISRQRYWGPPIPLIFCENCKKSVEKSKISKGELENPGWVPVPEEDLPIKLPYVEKFRPTGTGESPLASVASFYEVACPRCGGKARRETDVSDTFLDSAWYYIGYLMQNVNIKMENDSAKLKNWAPWDKELTKKWLPVPMYIGGAEHSVLHLLYVRFVALALRDMGILDFPSEDGEPMKKFRAHGLLIKDGAKMSKSKGNVINPDEYIKNFGADALRMYLMFIAPFEQGGDFRDEGILGIERFLNRVWKMREKVESRKWRVESGDKKLLALLHKTIRKVTDDIENLHYNTAISALMIFLNAFENEPDAESFDLFLKLLAPFAPHMTEEIWRNVLGRKTSIHLEPWPEYDEKLTQEEKFTLVIQVSGKVRDSVEVNAGISESEALETALQIERIINAVHGVKPKRVVYVPNKLINIVL